MLFFTTKKKYTEDEDLIADCLEGKRAAQEALYQRYSATMFATCLRYVGNSMEAEEVLLSGFLKVYQQLAHFKKEGSFEGWIRRVMINESLTLLRKRKDFYHESVETARHLADVHSSTDSALRAEELMNLVEKLPVGYKTVFNLYAIEGYGHKEIADMLGISEGTSKSQLNRARTMLKELLQQTEQLQTVFNS
ncbi:MAG: RNA polymerase sigma factor [Thermoflexibacteraceae bacterium]